MEGRGREERRGVKGGGGGSASPLHSHHPKPDLRAKHGSGVTGTVFTCLFGLTSSLLSSSLSPTLSHTHTPGDPVDEPTRRSFFTPVASNVALAFRVAKNKTFVLKSSKHT